MKTKRQNKILELISSKNIETQEELVERLLDAGFAVTQATISRDIKDLKLIKQQSVSGEYCYTVAKSRQSSDMELLMRIFRDTVMSIEYANNLIVIKTMSGSANVAAEAIDNLNYSGIMGTIAGDNTIFIATISSEDSQNIVTKFKEILER